MKKYGLFICFLVTSLTVSLSFVIPVTYGVFDESDVIFEHGGENDLIVPPWDAIQISPWVDGEVTLQSSFVRSGNKALKFYLNPESYPDTCRAEVVWWQLQYLELTDLYFSMWVYLPEDYSVDTWDAILDHHFFTHDPLTVYNIRKAVMIMDGEYPYLNVEWTNGTWIKTDNPFPTGQWVHVQEHLKLHLTEGERQIWIDDVLVYEETEANTANTREDVTATNIGSAEFKAYTDSEESGTVIKYMDDFVVSTEKVPETYGLEDIEAPQYSDVSRSTTTAGTSCIFSSIWSDNTALSGFIFGTNNTGSWQNETLTSLYTNPDDAEKIKTLTSSVGVRVEYQFWCKDILNNWNTTGTYYLTTVAPPTPPEEEEEEEPTPPAEDEITESFLSVPSALAVALTISELAARTLLSLTIVAIFVVLVAVFTRDRLTLTIVMLAGMALSVAFGFLDVFFLILSALIVALLYSGLINKVIGNE